VAVGASPPDVCVRATQDPDPEWLSVGRGLVAFVSFEKGATFAGAEAAGALCLPLPCAGVLRLQRTRGGCWQWWLLAAA